MIGVPKWRRPSRKKNIQIKTNVGIDVHLKVPSKKQLHWFNISFKNNDICTRYEPQTLDLLLARLDPLPLLLKTNDLLI